MEGWIKLHRSIVSHWIFCEARYLRAWILMLITVNYEDKTAMIFGEKIECKRGQSLLSIHSWAMLFGSGWSVDKVRTFFALLEKDKMILTKGLRKTTILTICNYELYQDQSRTESRTTPRRKPEENPTTKEGKEREEYILPNKRSAKNIPASIEFYKSCEEKSKNQEYKILCRFICGENKTGNPLKKILSLPEQLTEDQFNILKDKAHKNDKKVIQMLLDCEGKDQYTKGRVSLYLILNSWLNHTK